nr:hypothetical protein [Candidatus Entotheonella palauensis]
MDMQPTPRQRDLIEQARTLALERFAPVPSNWTARQHFHLTITMTCAIPVCSRCASPKRLAASGRI